MNLTESVKITQELVDSKMLIGNAKERLEAIKILTDFAQLAIKVSEGMPKENGDMVTPDGQYGYNQALADCNAFMTGKLAGINNLLENLELEFEIRPTEIKDKAGAVLVIKKKTAELINQAITNHFTQEEK